MTERRRWLHDLTMLQLRTIQRSMVMATVMLALAACKPAPPSVPKHDQSPSVPKDAESSSVPKHGDSKVVTLVVKWKLKAEFEQEALAYATDFIAKAAANEPDTVLYVLTKDPKEERTYYWIERYRDRAALQFHRDTDYRAQALGHLPKWLETFPPELFLELDQVIPK